jgi:hypothetical protein
MKKLISLLVLCGIFLGSFFSQIAKVHAAKVAATIHADSHESGNYHYHYQLIFSEISCETEGVDEKQHAEFKFIDYTNLLSENKYIKNTLRTFFIDADSKLISKYSLPVFLVTRSIII